MGLEEGQNRRNFLKNALAAAIAGAAGNELLHSDAPQRRTGEVYSNDMERMPGGRSPEVENDFKTQFERTGTVIVKGTDESSETAVQVTEINPPPEKITNPTPLVLAEAFAHPKKTYEEALRTLYKNGQRTLIFEHPRAGAEIPMADDEKEAVKDFIKNSPEEVRSALIMLNVLEAKNLPQVNVIPHSRGFAYTALAALIDDVRAKKENRPNRIRNIVAYGPAGLIGEDSLIPLGARVLSENFARPDWGGSRITMEQLAQEVSEERKEKIRTGELPADTESDTSKVLEELMTRKADAEARGIIEYGPSDEKGTALAKEMAGRVGSEGAKHVFGRLDANSKDASSLAQAGSGVGRTWREALGLSQIQLRGVVPQLRAMGIGVAIVRGGDDRVFPAARMDAYIRELQKEGVLDISITGVHDSIVQDPRVAHILEGALKQLESSRKTH